MESVRKELMHGVFLTHVPSRKFKTGVLSAQLIVPLSRASVASASLLPSVLRRGTLRCPDLRSLACELDRLYGASLSCTVRRKGENLCLGFISGFVDDAYVPKGERLLEPIADLMGELLLEPLTRNGRFLSEYVETEKSNLIDAIRGVMNDKRDYADMRLLQEMCAEESYGIPRYGTEKDVAHISNQTLFRYYQDVLKSAQIELFYCGSLPQERVEGALLRAFAALPREELIAPAIASRRSAPEAPRFCTEEMDVSQGKLAIGFRIGIDDHPAMLLANLLFGGYSNSKLFLNVREKLSLCYFASSTYHHAKNIVTVSSGIEFDKFSVAYDEILAQLRAVQNGEWEDWELEGARSCMIDSLQQREDSAGRMEEYFLYRAATGLTEPAEALIAALRETTGDRIRAAAQSMTLDTVYFLRGKEA